MRPERLYLTEMISAADTVARFLDGVPKRTFDVDLLLQSAVMYQLVVIGEAAAHVGHATRGRHPQVPWNDIVGFRNFAVHAYFSTDWDLVWHAAVTETPALRRDLIAVLAGLGPEP